MVPLDAIHGNIQSVKRCPNHILKSGINLKEHTWALQNMRLKHQIMFTYTAASEHSKTTL